MTSTLAIDYSALTRPWAAFADFIAELLPETEKEIDHLSDRAMLALSRARAQLDANIDQLTRLLSLVGKYVELGYPVDFDAIIADAERAEAMVEDEYQQTAKIVDRIKKLLRRFGPEPVRKLTPVFRILDGTAAAYLESLQQIRWQLMALRADTARPDDRGPIISSKTDLAKYWASRNFHA